MPRKNVRAKTTRRHHRRPEVVRTKTPPRTEVVRQLKVDAIVRPVGKCGTKLKFDTEKNAAKALAQAQAAHRGSGHVEKRYYLCPTCKGYHLTSREAWTDPKETS